MPDEKSPEIPMAGGVVSSSQVPRYELIPTEALNRTALRFEAGIARKGDRAWNALSSNQSALTDKEFILARIGHVVYHANKLRDKILAGTPMTGDDDAGAIAWAGMFLCCATAALAAKAYPGNCSACGGSGRIAENINGFWQYTKHTCPACKGTGAKGGKS